MADETKENETPKGKEGVEASATAAYVAERRAVTKAGQDEAMRKTAEGKDTPSQKQTESPKDDGIKDVLKKLDALESGLKERDKKIEKLEQDNFKLREQRRKWREEEEPTGRPSEEEGSDDADIEKLVEKMESRLMKKLSPVIETVRTLDVGTRVAGMAAADKEVEKAILSLPPDVQSSLSERLPKLVEAMADPKDEPHVAMKNAILYLAHRYGSQEPEGSETMLPETGGRPAAASESEDRKINRALFGAELVPEKPRYG